MISIKKNENFSNWWQVFSFGKLIDELNQEAKALKLANSLAKSRKQSYINLNGKAIKIENSLK
jgi:hypothetical protein